MVGGIAIAFRIITNYSIFIESQIHQLIFDFDLMRSTLIRFGTLSMKEPNFLITTISGRLPIALTGPCQSDNLILFQYLGVTS